MYQFILNMWIMCRYTNAQVELCVTKNYINQDQANMILATPQVPQV